MLKLVLVFMWMRYSHQRHQRHQPKPHDNFDVSFENTVSPAMLARRTPLPTNSEVSEVSPTSRTRRAPATPASRRPHMQNRVGPNQPAHSRPCPQTACIIRLPAQRDRRSSPCSGTLVALALLPATQN